MFRRPPVTVNVGGGESQPANGGVVGEQLAALLELLRKVEESARATEYRLMGVESRLDQALVRWIQLEEQRQGRPLGRGRHRRVA